MRRRAFLLGLLIAGTAAAQEEAASDAAAAVQSPILTIDTELLYRGSLFGKRMAAGLEAEGAALAAENRRIEAELTAEEKALTDQRAGMDPEAFSALADAFDEKVRTKRREQDGKARGLSLQQGAGRDTFLRAAAPVLEAMMRESGAAVVLDRREVFLSVTAIDITSDAIARIDAAIGDGADLDN